LVITESTSHYAVFPPALLDRPIEACCPRRVCRTCGTPSRRLTEADPEYQEQRDAYVARRAETHNGQNATNPDRLRVGLANKGLGEPTNGQNTQRLVTTTGWTSCDCPGTDGIRLDGYHTGTGWRPGLVLDPFGGSGTTGVVASGRSRDAILIDLDDRNADLARERLGMFLEVEHHTEAVVA
jgi:hypothetical protein